MILARLRSEFAPPDRPPEVHAYRADGDPVVWVSPCGDRIKPGEAEIVDPFTGNPCPKCLMLAVLASDAPPVTRAEAEDAPPPHSGPPEVPPTDVVADSPGVMLLYAPSWRERVVHYARPDARKRKYESSTVTVGVCGKIGWGPNEHPPEDWPMCPDCIEIASKGNP